MRGSRLVFDAVEFRRGLFTLAVSTSFREEALTVVLGPSGCGKTTLLDLALGFLVPEQGRILEGERDVTRLPPEKRTVGAVFQDHALFPHLSVRANVAYGPRARGASRKDAAAVADRLLELTRLEHLADRRPESLSGGERQRVALSRALAIDPDILLLDEPFSALDASLRVSMRREVRRIQEEIGITAVLVTHDQDEAMALADELAVMKDGRIVQQSSPGEVWRNPANLFTALFVGRASRLSVERYTLDGRGGPVAVTSAGPIPLPADSSPPALPATVIFRPESLESDGKGPLSGVMEHCEFAGGGWKGRLVPPGAPSGDLLEVDFPTGVRPTCGEHLLRFRLRNGEARVLPGRPDDVL